MPSEPESHYDRGTLRLDLQEQLDSVSTLCSQCQICVAECAFLKKYGDPKVLADQYDPTNPVVLAMPFECSLCGLCTAVCPDHVDPDRMFLEMRRETVSRGKGDFAEHRGLLAYEKRGTSKRYSWYALPAACDTVFFPGCALPGSRPETTLKLFAHIRQEIPTAGIVLDCCTKPSHDLGRQAHFDALFQELKGYLVGQGVRHVLVACPNCYQVFSQYAPEIQTRTVYEFLAQNAPVIAEEARADTVIHDPCVSRFAPLVHNAVRELLTQRGLSISEAPHSRQTTLCCGEGAGAGHLSPELATSWTRKRIREAQGHYMLTYCAGCSHILGSHTPTGHVLDLVFAPGQTLSGRVPVSKAPFTYLNRLRLKRRLQKEFTTPVTRERHVTAKDSQSGTPLKKLALFFTILAFIVAFRVAGLTEYLEQGRLRTLIEGYGTLAPLLYMLLYAVAPTLFLPGLPLTVVGGLLFGPFWGVVYTIISATTGACIAFLVSRYLARDWVEQKLKSPRWRHLDEQVAKHGWKMVAMTRLVPLFPFNLLNYAFGLTRIRFLPYAATTFLCMLPGCIAYIVFSSSLLDLIQGRTTPTLFLGLGLIALVSLIPVGYRLLRSRRLRKQQSRHSGN